MKDNREYNIKVEQKRDMHRSNKAIPSTKEIEKYNLPSHNFELKEIMAKNILDYSQAKKINKVLKDVQQQRAHIQNDLRERNEKKFEEHNKKAYELKKLNDRHRRQLLKKHKNDEHSKQQIFNNKLEEYHKK